MNYSYPENFSGEIQERKNDEKLKRMLENDPIVMYEEYLRNEEKGEATVSKYLRDVRKFLEFCGEESICKERVIAYKQHLLEGEYRASSINSMLAGVNSFLVFLGQPESKVKNVRVQRQVFYPKEKELTEEEYRRLCDAAAGEGSEMILLLLETLAATGVRVSELNCITVEAVQCGNATVNSKGKVREVFIVRKLRQKLRDYVKREGIPSGPIFLNGKGMPLNRTTIWRMLKTLCSEANVPEEKVYPHNFRHLFARVFYEGDKDIARLADILGHSSVDTTRIYLASSGDAHRKRMEDMKLVI